MNIGFNWLDYIIKSCLLSLASLVALPALAETKLVSVATIWGVEQSGLSHNAFTDLIRFKGQWYVGFRKAIKPRWAGTQRASSRASVRRWETLEVGGRICPCRRGPA